MFYLHFPVFIIYLYYLALLSALQTRQKHSQWLYADSAPFVEAQAEDYDKKMYLVFVCSSGSSLRGDERNHLKF